MRSCCILAGGLVGWALLASTGGAAEFPSAERGRVALTTQTFYPAEWKLSAYDDAWKLWGTHTKEPPANYEEAFRERYGLHPSPYENGRLPMGLRVGRSFFGTKGLALDCMICHGGSILGKSDIGLGNATLDLQALLEDLGKASGRSGKLPFVFSNVRGTSEAGAIVVSFMSYREPDLAVRFQRLDLGLRDDLCEDAPAWWLLKKKQTMYHTGFSNARSVRSIMLFMNTPTNSRQTIEKAEPTFADIQAFILGLTAPKYPFPIQRELADQGHKIFNHTCAKCHGTYGEKWTYPNKIVPIDVIGTDRTRLDGFSKTAVDHYNQSWFAKEKRPDGGEGYRVTAAVGYQAPPLDGIWATAPYLHNGSVPTIYDVLNSGTRPKIFTRSYRTDAEAYDPVKIGWKVQALERGPDASVHAHERRQVYDTTQPGRGNGGHTFGDHLSDDERRAVIEYLKTL